MPRAELMGAFRYSQRQSILRGKFIAMSAYIKNAESLDRVPNAFNKFQPSGGRDRWSSRSSGPA